MCDGTCFCYDLPAVLTVDRWRVVLKGETPDYINATVVHVSFHCRDSQLHTLANSVVSFDS